jgi:sulfotransferase
MDKTFFFMAGLPRSGSSLLSAILNQNSEIYASPQTDLLQMMWILDQNIPSLESYRAGIKINDYQNVLRSVGNSFYASQTEKFIIDKNRGWSTPGNYHLAQLLNPNIKIIMPYRPILEILASFVGLARKYPNTNYIDRLMRQSDFYSLNYRSIDDARCDWLMRSNGEIDQAILGLSQVLIKPSNLFLVKYDELVTNPEKIIHEIYLFLEIPLFKHTFNRIQSPNMREQDNNTFGIPTLHEVRPVISNQSIKPSDVLSDYVIEKYSNTFNFLERLQNDN